MINAQVDDQQTMMNNFQAAMAKLAVVGQDTQSLTDCSEVIPSPPPPVKKAATCVQNLAFR